MKEALLNMKSMTGYAQHQVTIQGVALTFELKSVNHRFLDTVFRLPKDWLFIEPALKKLVRSKITRGRAECYIQYQETDTLQQEVVLNWELYHQLLQEMATKLAVHPTSLEQEVLMRTLLQHDLFLNVKNPEISWQEYEEELLIAFEKGLDKLINTRETEGTYLQAVLDEHLSRLNELLELVATQQEAIESDWQSRLTEKLQELVGEQLDDSRILTEVALILEKGDITEELTRLESHSEQLATLFQSEEAIGREADFTIQEMNREINTIGSKSRDLAIKNLVVQLKTELEKLREQIQNIE